MDLEKTLLETVLWKNRGNQNKGSASNKMKFFWEKILAFLNRQLYLALLKITILDNEGKNLGNKNHIKRRDKTTGSIVWEEQIL